MVLSNNDGNVIARSREAKALGIPMGAPFFEVRNVLKAANGAVFSSNHGFFGEMSARFQAMLYQYSPRIEHYSIDEAFIEVEASTRQTITSICREIHGDVRQLAGVPVSIGVGVTKTLSKVALHYAKNSPKTAGVLDLSNSKYLPLALERLPVGEVWGIGPARAGLLERHGIVNALLLRDAQDCWIRQHLTVVGLRTVHELRGIVCFPLNPPRPARRMVSCSRAFGAATESLADVSAATAYFTSIAARKLRREGLVCGRLSVWISTDGFREDQPQYGNAQTYTVSPLSNCTIELSHLALSGLRKIYEPGFQYRRAGVSLSELQPEDTAPLRLFRDERVEGLRQLMQAMDYINAKFGRDTVRCGLYPSSSLWRTKAEHPAPGYTVQWSDVMRAK